MPQPQEGDIKGWTPIEDAKAGANLFMLAAQTMAAPVEVILRRNFGKQAFGWPSFFALFAIPMWMLFWPGEDPRPLWVFWWVFISMQFCARVESYVNAAGGRHVHTRYNGDSRLEWVLERWVKHENIKGPSEGMLVMLVGMLFMPVSEALGSYLVVAGMSVIAVMMTIVNVDRRRVEQLHDAWIEQRHVSEQFQEMQRRNRS